MFTARQIIDVFNGQNNCKIVYVPLVGITQAQAIRTLDYLKEKKKDLKINEFEISNQVLVIRLKEVLKGFSLEHFNHLIDSLVLFLKKQEIATTPTCVHCQNGDVNGVMKIDKIQFHAHQDCVSGTS